MSNLKEVCGGNGKGSSGGDGTVGGATNALTEIEMKIKDNSYSVVGNHVCLLKYAVFYVLCTITQSGESHQRK